MCITMYCECTVCERVHACTYVRVNAYACVCMYAHSIFYEPVKFSYLNITIVLLGHGFELKAALRPTLQREISCRLTRLCAETWGKFGRVIRRERVIATVAL